jgi:hypothetical protein
MITAKNVSDKDCLFNTWIWQDQLNDSDDFTKLVHSFSRVEQD